MQIEGTKLIFVMNFSVLHFFQICRQNASNCTDFSLNFQNFLWGGEGGGEGGACPWTPLEISSFFSLTIPGSVYYLCGKIYHWCLFGCL